MRLALTIRANSLANYRIQQSIPLQFRSIPSTFSIYRTFPCITTPIRLNSSVQSQPIDNTNWKDICKGLINASKASGKISSDVLVLCEKNIDEANRALSGSDFLDLLHLLSRCGWKYRSISRDPFRRAFASLEEKNLDQGTLVRLIQDLENLESTSKWVPSDFSEKLRNRLLAVLKCEEFQNPEEFAETMHWLFKISTKIPMSKEIIEQIFIGVEKWLPTMSEIAFLRLSHGFALGGYTWQNIPSQTQKVVEKYWIEKIQGEFVNPENFCCIFESGEVLRYQHSYLRQKGHLKVFVNHLQKFFQNEYNQANVSAQNYKNVGDESLNLGDQGEMLSRLIRITEKVNSSNIGANLKSKELYYVFQTLSIKSFSIENFLEVLQRMANFSVRWKQFPKPCRSVVEHKLVEALSDCTANILLSFLETARKLEYSWSENSNIRSLVFQRLELLYGKKFVNDPSIISMIYKLARSTRLSANNFSPEFREMIMKALGEQFHNIHRTDDLLVLMDFLRMFRYNWDDLQPKPRSDLQDQISTIIQKANFSMFIHLLRESNEISRVKLLSLTENPNIISSIEERLLSIISTSSKPASTTTIISSKQPEYDFIDALGCCKFIWGKNFFTSRNSSRILPKSLKDGVASALSKIATREGNDPDVSKHFAKLSQLDAYNIHWTDFPYLYREKLISSLVEAIPNMTNREITLFVSNATYLRFQWTRYGKLTAKVSERLSNYNKAATQLREKKLSKDGKETRNNEDRSEDEDGKNIAPLIYNLGRASFPKPSAKVLNILLTDVKKYQRSFRAEEVFYIILGLGQMKLKWNTDIPVDFQEVLLELLTNHLENTSLQRFSGILMGCSYLELPWYRIPSLKNLFNEQLSRFFLYNEDEVVNQMTGNLAREVSSIIHAMGLSGMKIEDLTPKVRMALVNAIEKEKDSLSEEQYSNILQAFNKIGL